MSMRIYIYIPLYDRSTHNCIIICIHVYIYMLDVCMYDVELTVTTYVGLH